MNPMMYSNATMNEAHDLHGIDLNLLSAFDALVRERSVTRAARRAGVTQSAMSHTLRRLRELTGDALLVRGGRGMVLTPRAEALMVPVRSGLTTLARALATPDVFEPRTAERSFRIVSPDLFDVLVLPGLLSRLASEAPSVDLAVVPAPKRLDEALETGEIDLAIVPVLLEGTDDTPSELRRRTLFRDDLRCFFRRGHPRLGKMKRLSMTRFLDEAHVLVSPSGSGPGVVDAHVSSERRIALRVPTFAVALAIVEKSDLVLTAPSALAVVAAARLSSLAPPMKLPGHAITTVWHPRFTDDAAHRWFRGMIAEAVPTW